MTSIKLETLDKKVKKKNKKSCNKRKDTYDGVDRILESNAGNYSKEVVKTEVEVEHHGTEVNTNLNIKI